MKLFAGGARGTHGVADPAFSRYGGDTTCYLIEGAGNERIVIDAGSGLRNVESRWRQERTGECSILLTHYHLDHLIGLPTFAPLYKSGWTIEFAAPRIGKTEPHLVVKGLFEKPLWPVQIEQLKGSLRFRTLPADGMAGRTLGGLHYRWCAVHHPGGCMAYRVDEEATGGSVVVATDFEWAESSEEERERLLELCSIPGPADLLLADGHYTPQDYERFRGWGHSRWSDCVELARAAGALRLRVIHHAPGSSDDHLAAVDSAVREALPGAGLLKQGQELVSGAET